MTAARRLMVLALVAIALPTARAAAADLTVSGGKLEWTIANYYAGGDPARTWLGYATQSGAGPQFSNGNVTATAPAAITGPTGAAVTTVDGTSARGTDQRFTFGFPVSTTGTAYNEAGVGTIELGGTLTFVTHGAPITIVDPVVKLDGLSGTLSASGAGLGSGMSITPTPYDRSKTQFNLDLSGATVSLRADGSRVISGIVPVSTADTVLSGFPAPSRLFGTMKLTLGVAYPATTALPAPRDGAAGPVGPAGPAGRAGASAKLGTFTLKRAAFATKSTRQVTLRSRATGAVLALGTVKSRTLRVAYVAGTRLKGASFKLRLVSGKVAGKRAVTVTIR